MKKIAKLENENLNLNSFSKFTGMHCSDIMKELSIDSGRASKNFLRVFVDKLITESGANIDNKEYIVKTIRMVQPHKTKESMSLRVVDYCSMVDQTWDISDFRKELSHTFVFFIFEGPASIDATVFKNVITYNFTEEDLMEAKKIWTDTILKIRANDYSSFISEKDTGTFFFKIHASTTSDVLPTPENGESVKRSFWIAKKFVNNRILIHME